MNTLSALASSSELKFRPNWNPKSSAERERSARRAHAQSAMDGQVSRSNGVWWNDGRECIFVQPDPYPMLLSRTCEYGIRAMVYLAAEAPSEYRSVRAISAELDISFHFLTKIFQQLSRFGLLKSYRGPNGGVMLSRPASEITLKDVVVAIEGPDLFSECVLGLPGCGHERPCPLHDSWTLVREELDHMLEGRRLDQIGKDVIKGQLRLTRE